MKRIDYYKKTIKLLEELHRDHPEMRMGQHISTAFSDYPDVWHVSEKEIFYAIEKYNSQLELDIIHLAPEDYVNQIEEDGKHLFDTNLEDEEEGEEDY